MPAAEVFNFVQESSSRTSCSICSSPSPIGLAGTRKIAELVHRSGFTLKAGNLRTTSAVQKGLTKTSRSPSCRRTIRLPANAHNLHCLVVGATVFKIRHPRAARGRWARISINFELGQLAAITDQRRLAPSRRNRRVNKMKTKGMARMAITIINQSLCLRSNFIIAEKFRGGCAQPQIAAKNLKSQAPISKQISFTQINRALTCCDFID